MENNDKFKNAKNPTDNKNLFIKNGSPHCWVACCWFWNHDFSNHFYNSMFSGQERLGDQKVIHNGYPVLPLLRTTLVLGLIVHPLSTLKGGSTGEE